MSGQNVHAGSQPLAPSMSRVVAWLVVVTPPMVAGAGALLLALSAMLPGVGFWDTAEFQTVAPLLGTAHSPGYPTYVILGWLANITLTPFGEPAFRMNLLSGLSVAAAAALTVVLMRHLTGRSAIGVAVGLGLAASPLAWRVGTHAEPHALHLAFVAVLLVLLVRWDHARRRLEPRADRWLVAASAAFGLAAANHSLTLLLAPAIGAYVLAVQPAILRRPRLIATCTTTLIGMLALAYLELPLRAGAFRAPLVYGEPDTWNGFWYIVLAAQFLGSVANPFEDLPSKAGELAALAHQELDVLAMLLPLGLVVTVLRLPRYALLTGLATLVTVLFSASYANADIARYYLGPLLMAWTWIGVLAWTATGMVLGIARIAVGRVAASERTGVDTDRELPNAARNLEWLAGALVALGVAVLLLRPTLLALPARHTSLDQRGDDSARVWLDDALGRMAQNAVVVSWWSYSTPLWYAQKVEGRRPDIFIVDDRTILDEDLGGVTEAIGKFLGQRPVYVIRASQRDLGLVLSQFELRGASGPASNVYEVVGRVRAAT